MESDSLVTIREINEDLYLKEERAWVDLLIKDLLKEPYFFTKQSLIVSKDDLEKVYKRLKDRIWTDKDGQARLWYFKVVVYHNQEEYVWRKILQ